MRDNTIIGTDKVKSKHIYVNVAYGLDQDGVKKPVYQLDTAWERFNV
jgi:hypothetical protein